MMFRRSTLRPLGQQAGETEKHLKHEVATLLRHYHKPARAYLCRVSYTEEPDQDNERIALCLAAGVGVRDEMRYAIASIIRDLYGRDENPDIIVLNKALEAEVRQACRPFIDTVDFVLISTECDDPEDPRACVVLKWFEGDHRDGFLLVSIDPPLIGQQFGLGDRDVEELVLAAKHQGYSLNPITEWPTYVHVALLADDEAAKSNSLSASDVTVIDWGAIYEGIDDVSR